MYVEIWRGSAKQTRGSDVSEARLGGGDERQDRQQRIPFMATRRGSVPPRRAKTIATVPILMAELGTNLGFLGTGISRTGPPDYRVWDGGSVF